MSIRLTIWLALAGLALPGSSEVSARQSAGNLQSGRVEIAEHVHEAAQRFGMPERWIYAVIRSESAGRVRAVSRAGAMGLMQLMPGTWARQRDRFALGSDPFDPRDNILAGTSYLREMYDRYGVAGFLAAYNAGPGRYEAWLAGRRNLPLETRRYVARTAGLLHADTLPGGDGPTANPPLFAAPSPMETSQGRAPGAEAAANEILLGEPEQASHDLFVPVSTGDER